MVVVGKSPLVTRATTALAGIGAELGASAFLGPAAVIGVAVVAVLAEFCDSCRQFFKEVRLVWHA